MKNLAIFFLLAVSTSMTFASFDQTISNTYEYGVELMNLESLLVTGGGADSIDAFNTSYVEIKNTAPYQAHVGGILGLYLHDSSNLHFFDGEIIGLDIKSDATAVLEGGQISSIESWQDVFVGNDVIKHIEIKCKTFSYSSNLLTGTWADDTAFSIKLIDQPGYDSVINNISFTVVPEPASLVLLGLGGLLIRRRSISRKI